MYTHTHTCTHTHVYTHTHTHTCIHTHTHMSSTAQRQKRIIINIIQQQWCQLIWGQDTHHGIPSADGRTGHIIIIIIIITIDSFSKAQFPQKKFKLNALYVTHEITLTDKILQCMYTHSIRKPPQWHRTRIPSAGLWRDRADDTHTISRWKDRPHDIPSVEVRTKISEAPFLPLMPLADLGNQCMSVG